MEHLRKPVLIIEDDEDIRMAFEMALESEGCDVQLAENGKVALELLRSLPDEKLPGLILLDLMMPVMNGAQFVTELCREVRSSMREIPIYVVTAKGNPNLATDSPVLGYPRLQKPVDLDDVLRIVEKHCGLLKV